MIFMHSCRINLLSNLTLAGLVKSHWTRDMKHNDANEVELNLTVPVGMNASIELPVLYSTEQMPYVTVTEGTSLVWKGEQVEEYKPAFKHSLTEPQLDTAPNCKPLYTCYIVQNCLLLLRFCPTSCPTNLQANVQITCCC
eukprot:m.131794 g.131794  ORF g.131794 m.131794 type:complete len:140 (-) comp14636_c0_seq2:255-674(-)